MTTPDSGYQLGSDAAELERLDHQGRALAPATRAILEIAGLRAGMRVLDLGSGAGDLTFTAIDLVGPSGEIVGVDQSPDAVARATARARQRQLCNVRFIVGDIAQPIAEGRFDAIICRLVLMYLPDPAAVLRAQATVLRPNGLVAPIEFDIPSARTLPPTPLLEQVSSWILRAFTRAGAATSLGPRLWSVLTDAGLRPAGMVGVQPHFGPDDPDGVRLLSGVVRALLPVIERTGVATAAEVEIDTLPQRLRDSLAASAAVFAFPMLLSAWALKVKS